MSRRSIFTVSVLSLSVLALAGCAGPTKTGLENRAAAYERMATINSKLSYDQAEQAFEAGNFDKALREVATAIERHPTAPAYHLLQGRIYLETHRLESAVGCFKEAMELAPDYAEAEYFTGIVFQRWSDDQKAYEHYSHAAELDPSSVQFLMASAETLVELGEVETAKALINTRLSRFENNAALRHLLGRIAQLQHDPAGAIQLFTEARLLNPDDPTLLEELAWAQFDAGDFGDCYESVEQLGRFGVITEERTDLVHLEARCLSFMGRMSEARNVYLQLSRDRANDADVWVELGSVAWELGDFRRVALSGVRAIALAPDRFEGYMLKGVSEESLGRATEAVAFFRQAADRAPFDVSPHLLLGQALEQAGDYDGARRAYEAAMAADPTNSDADVLYRTLEQRRVTSATTAMR